MINIVLLEPEQGGNVGNIGRTCLAIGARLHLIEPLGFRLTDKEIKRAGMDYWHQVDVTRYDDYKSVWIWLSPYRYAHPDYVL